MGCGQSYESTSNVAGLVEKTILWHVGVGSRFGVAGTETDGLDIA
jgi:hypothetical protein